MKNYAMRQAFADPDPAVRLMVIESLAQSGEGTDLLHEALTDPDESVNTAAAQMLKETTDNTDNSTPNQQDEQPQDQQPPNN